jgi:hypothetical protein
MCRRGPSDLRVVLGGRRHQFGIRAHKGSLLSVAEKKKKNSPCHQGEGTCKHPIHQRIGKCREEEAGR